MIRPIPCKFSSNSSSLLDYRRLSFSVIQTVATWRRDGSCDCSWSHTRARLRTGTVFWQRRHSSTVVSHLVVGLACSCRHDGPAATDVTSSSHASQWHRWRALVYHFRPANCPPAAVSLYCDTQPPKQRYSFSMTSVRSHFTAGGGCNFGPRKRGSIKKEVGQYPNVQSAVENLIATAICNIVLNLVIDYACEWMQLYRVVRKTDTQFYFWDNLGNSAPILTILSLLQAEIYGA